MSQKQITQEQLEDMADIIGGLYGESILGKSLSPQEKQVPTPPNELQKPQVPPSIYTHWHKALEDRVNSRGERFCSNNGHRVPCPRDVHTAAVPRTPTPPTLHAPHQDNTPPRPVPLSHQRPDRPLDTPQPPGGPAPRTQPPPNQEEILKEIRGEVVNEGGVSNLVSVVRRMDDSITTQFEAAGVGSLDQLARILNEGVDHLDDVNLSHFDSPGDVFIVVSQPEQPLSQGVAAVVVSPDYRKHKHSLEAAFPGIHFLDVDELPKDLEQSAAGLAKPLPEKRFHIPPSIYPSYAVKAGFTGVFRDALGRQTCYAAGRKISCPKKPEEQDPHDIHKVRQPTPQQAAGRRDTTSDHPPMMVEQPEEGPTYYAVVFNPEGKVLVPTEEPQGFVQNVKGSEEHDDPVEAVQASVQEESGVETLPVGKIGDADKSEGYFLLTGRGDGDWKEPEEVRKRLEEIPDEVEKERYLQILDASVGEWKKAHKGKPPHITPSRFGKALRVGKKDEGLPETKPTTPVPPQPKQPAQPSRSTPERVPAEPKTRQDPNQLPKQDAPKQEPQPPGQPPNREGWQMTLPADLHVDPQGFNSSSEYANAASEQAAGFARAHGMSDEQINQYLSNVANEAHQKWAEHHEEQERRDIITNNVVEKNIDTSPVGRALRTGTVANKTPSMSHTINVGYVLDIEGDEGPVRAYFKPAVGEVEGPLGVQRQRQQPRPGIPPRSFWKREFYYAFAANRLGLGRLVPTTVLRDVDGQVGSLQEWVPNGTELWNNNDYANIDDETLAHLAILDYVLRASDRNQGNALRGPDGDKAIDNGISLSNVDSDLTFAAGNRSNEFLRTAAYLRGLRIPRTSEWEAEWGSLEDMMRVLQFEPDAIELHKRDLLTAVRYSRKMFAELPANDGSGRGLADWFPEQEARVEKLRRSLQRR